MSEKSDDDSDEGPRCPRVRAYSYDVTRTAATIRAETSITEACSGTSDVFRWMHTHQNQDSLPPIRRAVRRASTWDQ
jgi:hypothetical protein